MDIPFRFEGVHRTRSSHVSMTSEIMTTKVMTTRRRTTNSHRRHRWRIILDNVDFDIRVRNADFNHWVRWIMRRILEILVCLATFAEIKVGTHGALIADAADTGFLEFAGCAVAVDVRVNEILAVGQQEIELSREMLVDRGKAVLRVDFIRVGEALVAEIVVATFEAFVPNSNDVLCKFIGGGYRLAFVAVSVVFHTSSGVETSSNFRQARSFLVKRCILEDKSVCRMMMILVIHKAINAQREVITGVAQYIRRHTS
jgi:hypothetical protein